MNQKKIKCQCGYEFEEPNVTKTAMCPICGKEGILVTTKDMESMQEAAKQSNSEHHFIIDNIITIGDKKFKVSKEIYRSYMTRRFQES